MSKLRNKGIASTNSVLASKGIRFKNDTSFASIIDKEIENFTLSFLINPIITSSSNDFFLEIMGKYNFYINNSNIKILNINIPIVKNKVQLITITFNNGVLTAYNNDKKSASTTYSSSRITGRVFIRALSGREFYMSNLFIHRHVFTEDEVIKLYNDVPGMLHVLPNGFGSKHLKNPEDTVVYMPMNETNNYIVDYAKNRYTKAVDTFTDKILTTYDMVEKKFTATIDANEPNDVIRKFEIKALEVNDYVLTIELPKNSIKELKANYTENGTVSSKSYLCPDGNKSSKLNLFMGKANEFEIELKVIANVPDFELKIHKLFVLGNATHYDQPVTSGLVPPNNGFLSTLNYEVDEVGRLLKYHNGQYVTKDETEITLGKPLELLDKDSYSMEFYLNRTTDSAVICNFSSNEQLKIINNRMSFPDRYNNNRIEFDTLPKNKFIHLVYTVKFDKDEIIYSEYLDSVLRSTKATPKNDVTVKVSNIIKLFPDNVDNALFISKSRFYTGRILSSVDVARYYEAAIAKIEKIEDDTLDVFGINGKYVVKNENRLGVHLPTTGSLRIDRYDDFTLYTNVARFIKTEHKFFAIDDYTVSMVDDKIKVVKGTGTPKESIMNLNGDDFILRITKLGLDINIIINDNLIDSFKLDNGNGRHILLYGGVEYYKLVMTNGLDSNVDKLYVNNTVLLNIVNELLVTNIPQRLKPKYIPMLDETAVYALVFKTDIPTKVEQTIGGVGGIISTKYDETMIDRIDEYYPDVNIDSSGKYYHPSIIFPEGKNPEHKLLIAKFNNIEPIEEVIKIRRQINITTIDFITVTNIIKDRHRVAYYLDKTYRFSRFSNWPRNIRYNINDKRSISGTTYTIKSEVAIIEAPYDAMYIKPSYRGVMKNTVIMDEDGVITDVVENPVHVDDKKTKAMTLSPTMPLVSTKGYTIETSFRIAVAPTKKYYFIKGVFGDGLYLLDDKLFINFADGLEYEYDIPAEAQVYKRLCHITFTVKQELKHVHIKAYVNGKFSKETILEAPNNSDIYLTKIVRRDKDDDTAVIRHTVLRVYNKILNPKDILSKYNDVPELFKPITKALIDIKNFKIDKRTSGVIDHGVNRSNYFLSSTSNYRMSGMRRYLLKNKDISNTTMYINITLPRYVPHHYDYDQSNHADILHIGGLFTLKTSDIRPFISTGINNALITVEVNNNNNTALVYVNNKLSKEVLLKDTITNGGIEVDVQLINNAGGFTAIDGSLTAKEKQTLVDDPEDFIYYSDGSLHSVYIDTVRVKHFYPFENRQSVITDYANLASERDINPTIKVSDYTTRYLDVNYNNGEYTVSVKSTTSSGFNNRIPLTLEVYDLPSGFYKADIIETNGRKIQVRSSVAENYRISDGEYVSGREIISYDMNSLQAKMDEKFISETPIYIDFSKGDRVVIRLTVMEPNITSATFKIIGFKKIDSIAIVGKPIQYPLRAKRTMAKRYPMGGSKFSNWVGYKTFRYEKDYIGNPIKYHKDLMVVDNTTISILDKPIRVITPNSGALSISIDLSMSGVKELQDVVSFRNMANLKISENKISIGTAYEDTSEVVADIKNIYYSKVLVVIDPSEFGDIYNIYIDNELIKSELIISSKRRNDILIVGMFDNVDDNPYFVSSIYVQQGEVLALSYDKGINVKTLTEPESTSNQLPLLSLDKPNMKRVGKEFILDHKGTYQGKLKARGSVRKIYLYNTYSTSLNRTEMRFHVSDDHDFMYVGKLSTTTKQFNDEILKLVNTDQNKVTELLYIRNKYRNGPLTLSNTYLEPGRVDYPTPNNDVLITILNGVLTVNGTTVRTITETFTDIGLVLGNTLIDTYGFMFVERGVLNSTLIDEYKNDVLSPLVFRDDNSIEYKDVYKGKVRYRCSPCDSSWNEGNRYESCKLRRMDHTAMYSRKDIDNDTYKVKLSDDPIRYIMYELEVLDSTEDGVSVYKLGDALDQFGKNYTYLKMAEGLQAGDKLLLDSKPMVFTKSNEPVEYSLTNAYQLDTDNLVTGGMVGQIVRMDTDTLGITIPTFRLGVTRDRLSSTHCIPSRYKSRSIDIYGKDDLKPDSDLIIDITKGVSIEVYIDLPSSSIYDFNLLKGDKFDMHFKNRLLTIKNDTDNTEVKLPRARASHITYVYDHVKGNIKVFIDSRLVVDKNLKLTDNIKIDTVIQSNFEYNDVHLDLLNLYNYVIPDNLIKSYQVLAEKPRENTLLFGFTDNSKLSIIDPYTGTLNMTKFESVNRYVKDDDRRYTIDSDIKSTPYITGKPIVINQQLSDSGAIFVSMNRVRLNINDLIILQSYPNTDIKVHNKDNKLHFDILDSNFIRGEFNSNTKLIISWHEGRIVMFYNGIPFIKGTYKGRITDNEIRLLQNANKVAIEYYMYQDTPATSEQVNIFNKNHHDLAYRDEYGKTRSADTPMNKVKQLYFFTEYSGIYNNQAMSLKHLYIPFKLDKDNMTMDDITYVENGQHIEFNISARMYNREFKFTATGKKNTRYVLELVPVNTEGLSDNDITIKFKENEDTINTEVGDYDKSMSVLNAPIKTDANGNYSFSIVYTDLYRNSFMTYVIRLREIGAKGTYAEYLGSEYSEREDRYRFNTHPFRFKYLDSYSRTPDRVVPNMMTSREDIKNFRGTLPRLGNNAKKYSVQVLVEHGNLLIDKSVLEFIKTNNSNFTLFGKEKKLKVKLNLGRCEFSIPDKYLDSGLHYYVFSINVSSTFVTKVTLFIDGEEIGTESNTTNHRRSDMATIPNITTGRVNVVIHNFTILNFVSTPDDVKNRYRELLQEVKNK